MRSVTKTVNPNAYYLLAMCFGAAVVAFNFLQRAKWVSDCSFYDWERIIYIAAFVAYFGLASMGVTVAQTAPAKNPKKTVVVGLLYRRGVMGVDFEPIYGSMRRDVRKFILGVP